MEPMWGQLTVLLILGCSMLVTYCIAFHCWKQRDYVMAILWMLFTLAGAMFFFSTWMW